MTLTDENETIRRLTFTCDQCGKEEEFVVDEAARTWEPPRWLRFYHPLEREVDGDDTVLTFHTIRCASGWFRAAVGRARKELDERRSAAAVTQLPLADDDLLPHEEEEA